MIRALKVFLKAITGSARDLASIVTVLLLFQYLVLQQPLPEPGAMLAGFVCVVLGLTLFVFGLDMALFPAGEGLANDFARKGSVFWLLIFAFALGFGTTIAEPALIAVTREAAKVAADSGYIDNLPEPMERYANGLRVTVAVAVGCAIAIGVIRILKGWPLHYLIIGGYLLVMLITAVAPPEIVGIAYDSGGVTTSTVTVPLVTALGIGLASSIRGRSPIVEGFGLIAFASLTPMIFVMLYGMLT